MGSSQSKSPCKTVQPEGDSIPPTKGDETPEKILVDDDQTKPQITVSGPKTPTNDGPSKPTIDLNVTEEEMASVEAAATKIRDSVGGTSLEIVLSPAIKKVYK